MIKVGEIVSKLKAELLEAGFKGTLALDTPLSPHTTWEVGGPAALLADVPTIEDLRLVMSTLSNHSLPLLIMGAGSNLLVSDQGFDGAVLRLTGDFDTVRITGADAEVGAALPLTRLVHEGCRQGLKGIERLAGIPGYIGGAIYMNAGTYGEYIDDLLEAVDVFTRSGTVATLGPEDCDFGYRSSRFHASDEIILGCRLSFELGDAEEIRAEVDRRLERRRSTQPVHLPSCGSVFRNPPGELSAAQLIEEAGLKGTRSGGAAISEMHANFIVNEGGAKATDIIALMALARQTVRERTGITLVPEVRACGFQSSLEVLLDEWTN